MMTTTRTCFAMVAALTLGGCLSFDFDQDGVFACVDDADCASGFSCVNDVCVRGGAGGSGGMSGEPLDSPYTLNADDVESSVVVHVEPGITGVHRGVADDLDLVVEADTLASAANVTVSEVSAAAAPLAVIGRAYQIAPSTLEFSKPLRARFFSPLPGTATAEHTRPVRFDTGTTSYRILDDWTYLPDVQAWAGDVTSPGVYGVADGDVVLLTEDSLSGARQRGDEYLALRRPDLAVAAYDAAVAEDEADRQAHLGAALAKIAMLSESPLAHDLFERCGEPSFDPQGQFLGPNGVLAWEERTRLGASTVTLESGISSSNHSPAPFRPNAIRAELINAAVPLRIDVQLPDMINEADGGRMELALHFADDAPIAPPWADGATYDLSDPAFNGAYAVATLVDEDDRGYQGHTRVVSGTVTVDDAGTTVGEPIQITLADVTFERMSLIPTPGQCDLGCCEEACDVGFVCPDECCNTDYCPLFDSVERVHVFNGVINDVLHEDYEFDTALIPFADMGYDFGPPQRDFDIQIIEACAPVDGPYLLGLLHDLQGEWLPIRTHLEAVAAGTPSGFLFEVPIGAFGNTLPLKMGVAEVYVLLSGLAFLDAAVAIGDQYHVLDTDLATLAATQSGVRRVDRAALAAELNGTFLLPVGSPSFVPAVQDEIELGIVYANTALDQDAPTGAAVDPQGTVSQEAADALVAFGDLLLDSATGAQSLPLTPEYEVDLQNGFTNPLTLFDLETAAAPAAVFGGDASGFLWMDNDAQRACIDYVFTPPNSPETPQDRALCASDGDCTDPVDTGLRCTGFGEESTGGSGGAVGDPGICRNAGGSGGSGGTEGLDCNSQQDCQCGAAGGGGSGAAGGSGGTGGTGGAPCPLVCDHRFCMPRDPQFAFTSLVEELFDPTVPTFMLSSAWDALVSSWETMLRNSKEKP